MMFRRAIGFAVPFGALLWVSCGGAVADDRTKPVYAVAEVEPYPSAESGGNYLFNYYLPPTANTSPWAASWSADGRHLYFALHGSLWKIAAGGGTATEIKRSELYLSSPVPSPDGRYLAYTEEDQGVSINLRVLDLETQRDTAVTEGDFVNVDPAWSPDSRRLAFVSTLNDGDFHIYTVTLRGGKARKPVSITHSPGDENIDPKTNRTGMHTSPTFTPDGKQIVFVWNRNAERGAGGLWQMAASQHGIQSAQPIHQEESVYRLRPDVSPDGTRIVYSSYLGEQFNNLYIIPTTGGTPYKLTFATSDNFAPRWSPDGRRVVYLSNADATTQIRTRDVVSGADDAVEITDLKWMEATSQLTVRTIDAESGDPIGARLYLRASDGRNYAPANHYHRVARRLGEHYFHSNGSFELALPTGDVTIEAHHGFEYYPVLVTQTLLAGEDKLITIALKRMTDASTRGWYSGDNHVHMNYGGTLHNSPANLVAMAAAEGLSVVNALVANKYTRIIDHQYYSGRPDDASTDDTILYFNQEYRPPFFGHLSFLGINEQLIAPFAAGLDGTALESLYPSNTDVLREAARQNAMGGYVHPYRGPEDPILDGLGGARTFPVDLALGTLGYHELTSQASWGSYSVWHHALNAGFRVPIVGGEDAITDLHRMYVLGQLRTYAKLQGALSWDNWLDAIRAGRTVVTNGPLLTLSVDDVESGGELNLDAAGPVRVKGTVQSIVPLEHIELVVNGIPLTVCENSCPADPDGAGTRIRFERDIEITESSWITLQAYNEAAVHPLDDHFAQATTNATWVTLGDQPIRKTESVLYFQRWIRELLRQLEEQSGWRTEDEKLRVLEQFRAADREMDNRLRQARAHCPGRAIDADTLAAIDRDITALRDSTGAAVQYSAWLGDGCGETLYAVNSDVIIPAASSIKIALLLEFYAENSSRLNETLNATAALLADPEAPSIRHFNRGEVKNLRRELVGLSARQLGEAMIHKKHVSSNAAYNAAANVIIAALGGPEAATAKIRARHPAADGLSISRYMLADRSATGDNQVSLQILADIHRSIAMRTVPGVDDDTIDAVRNVLRIRNDRFGQHFYKGGSLSSDPQVRIEAGWLQSPDDSVLIYAIAGHRTDTAENRDAQYETLRSGVTTLSNRLLSWWRDRDENPTY